MPADIERCVKKLEGHPEIDNPYAMCKHMKETGKKMPAEAAERRRASLRALRLHRRK